MAVSFAPYVSSKWGQISFFLAVILDNQSYSIIRMAEQTSFDWAQQTSQVLA